MPYFEIEGYGQETKRKRKRTYTAKDREEAIRLATQEGTVAEHVTRVEVMGFMPQLAGASHKNPDNTSRQRLLHSCQPFERLVLEHEIWARHPNATRVLRTSGQQLGYLQDDLAAFLMANFYGEDGYQYAVRALTIRTFDDRTSLLTMDLLVFIALPGTEHPLIARYVESYLNQNNIRIDHTSIAPMERLISRTRPQYHKPRQQRAVPEPQRETYTHHQRSQTAKNPGCSMLILALLLVTTIAIRCFAF